MMRTRTVTTEDMKNALLPYAWYVRGGVLPGMRMHWQEVPQLVPTTVYDQRAIDRTFDAIAEDARVRLENLSRRVDAMFDALMWRVENAV